MKAVVMYTCFCNKKKKCKSCFSIFLNILFIKLLLMLCFYWLQVNFVPYDERLLPALQRRNWPVESIQSPANDHSPKSDMQRAPHSTETNGEPEPLTEKAQREAGLPIEVYGETLVRKCHAETRTARLFVLSSFCFLKVFYFYIWKIQFSQQVTLSYYYLIMVF